MEFLILLIHLIKINYEKNTKPCFSNLFVHKIHSIFRAPFNKKRLNIIGNDWHKKGMKKIGKD